MKYSRGGGLRGCKFWQSMGPNRLVEGKRDERISKEQIKESVWPFLKMVTVLHKGRHPCAFLVPILVPVLVPAGVAPLVPILVPRVPFRDNSKHFLKS